MAVLQRGTVLAATESDVSKCDHDKALVKCEDALSRVGRHDVVKDHLVSIGRRLGLRMMDDSKLETLVIRIDERTRTLVSEMTDMKQRMSQQYVTRDEFEPIKRLIYGLVWTVMAAVVMGVLGLILKGGVV